MNLRLLLQLLREESRVDQLVLTGLMLLVAVTEGVSLLLLVPIIEQAQDQPVAGNAMVPLLKDALLHAGLPDSLGALLLTLLGLVVIREVLRFHRDTRIVRLQFSVVDHHRDACFRLILESEWNFVNRHALAHYSNILITDINRIGQGLRFALNAVTSLVLLCTYLVTALILSPTMTLIALAGATVLLAGLGQFRSRATRLGQSLSGSNRAIHHCIQQTLSGLKLAKILRGEARLLQEFRSETRHMREQQLQFQRTSAAANGLMQSGAAVLLVAFLYAGFRLWHMPLAELAVLALIMARIAPQAGNLQQQWLQWLHAIPAARDVLDLQRSHRIASEMQTAQPDSVCNTPLQVRQGIELKQIVFCHPERNQPALHALDLHLPAGSITLVTGASGAGKSTLVDLLLGLVIPASGSLLIDGRQLQSADRLRWRQSVACVPQDTFLFNTSIRQNLLWAAPSAREEDLLQALHLAAADFVLSLPQGLDTPVGERGMRLSGGERQRLALARALITRPALLVLDEPTSALDRESEQQILHALRQLRGRTTLLIISHRPALLALADQVLTLEHGSLQTSTETTHT